MCLHGVLIFVPLLRVVQEAYPIYYLSLCLLVCRMGSRCYTIFWVIFVVQYHIIFAAAAELWCVYITTAVPVSYRYPELPIMKQNC